MKVKELKAVLKENAKKKVQISLQGQIIPVHFHVTEVGHVVKNFVDCGGVVRKTEACVIQIWVADDEDHRIDTDKFSRIMEFSSSIVSDDLSVEAEYGEKVASQYKIGDAQVTNTLVLLSLLPKQTECLAPEKCGVSGCRVG